MGPLTPPAGAEVYLDANAIIYSVERIAPYRALMQPLWDGSRAGAWRICTSELALLETLVGPLRTGNVSLEDDYRHLLLRSLDLRLAPITLAVLERAARLRATTPSLKTPDAIHAATALVEGCALFVTNDAAFSHVPGLNVRLLRDLMAP